MALSVGRIFGLIELRDQFTAGLRNAASEVDRAVPKVKQLQKQFDDLGGNLRNAGFALTAGITAPIAAVGALALKSSIDFQGAMNRLEASSNGTAEQVASDMVKMRAAAIEWGAKTQFSSTQAADALTELQKGGLSANQAIAALPSTLQLATAGQMGLADAATLSANTMATFGLRAEDMARANDALAKAANLSTIDVRDLAESFKYVGPVARQSGVSLEFTAASMAAMGEAGIKGSMGGTALRGVLTTLMTPTDKQADLMKKLGLETAFADGKMKSLPDILAMVEGAIKKTGNAGQVGADLMELFGDRAGPGMLALVNKGSAGLAELEKKLHETGYAARVQESMMKGLPGAIEKMSGAVETAATSFGEILAPAAEVVASGIEKLANFITNYLVPAFQMLPGPVQAYIGLIVALAAVVGPLLVVLGGLSSAFAAMLPLLTSVGLLTTTAATAEAGMTTATVALNTALLTTIARFTVIGGLIAGIIAAAPKAWEGLKNLGDIGGESWKQDTSSPLYWRKWMPGATWNPEDPNAPKVGRGKHVNLAAPTFNIEGIEKTFTQGKGGLAESLKEVNKEYNEFLKHPAKVKDLTAAIKSGAFTQDQLAKSSGMSEMALKMFTDRVKDADQKQKDITKSTQTYNAELAKQDAQMRQQWALYDMQRELVGQSQRALERYATEPIPLIDMQSDAQKRAIGANERLTKSLQDNVKGALKPYLDEQERGKKIIAQATAEIEKQEAAMRKGLAYGSKLAGVIQSALQGGGDVSKALGSTIGGDLGNMAGEKLGGVIAKGIGGKLGGMIGGIAGSWLGPVGSMVGGWLGGKIGDMFGGNKGRKAVEGWVNETFGSFDKLQAKLANVKDGDKLWKQLTQGARTPEQAEAAIKAVTAALGEQQAKVEGITNSVMDMVTAHVGAGVIIPDSVRATIASLVEQGRITKENAAELLGINAAVPSFNDVKSAADVLGVSIDAIGPKISNMAFAERVTPMIGAFETLEAAGADMGAVFAQSTTKVQPLVLEALKFGREMPDAMRPWLQRMVDSGLLLDENGNKLTDLSRINFAEPLTAALDRLIAKLDEFVQTIQNKTGPALVDLGKTRIPPIKVPYQYVDESSGETTAEGFATGGRVLSFKHRGTDNIPAMLTPGEIVLNAAQQDNVAAALTMNDPAASATVDSRPVHIHMYQDGRKTGEAIVPHLADIINVNVA